MPWLRGGPDLWFSLIVLGAFFTYWELVRPRFFVPGGIGLFLLVFGGCHLALNGLTTTSTVCFLFAVGMFSINLMFETQEMAPAAGTAAFTAAALYLKSAQGGIHPVLAIVGAALVAGLTSLLTERARRARTNKRADL